MVDRTRRTAGDAGAPARRSEAVRRSAAAQRSRSAPTRQEELNAAIELLHFAFRTMIGEPDRLLARRDLGRMHHRILYFVARSPGASVGELTRTLGVTKQALNGPLRQLVAAGLVAWTRADADQRVKRLALTAEGRRLEAKLSALQRAQFAAAFASAGPRAERAWRETMRAFAEAEMRRAGRWQSNVRDRVSGIGGRGSEGRDR